MLNSGKKIPTLRDKKINILTLVLSKKKFLNETKNHNPPLQVKWSVPYTYCTSCGTWAINAFNCYLIGIASFILGLACVVSLCEKFSVMYTIEKHSIYKPIYRR